MRHGYGLLALLLTGCAGSQPSAQDTLEEIARGLTALNGVYHSECDGREDDAHCIALQRAYNLILAPLERGNSRLPQ